MQKFDENGEAAPSDAFRLRRRDFLFLSSAAALGVATSGLASEAARAIGLGPTERQRWSVGYSKVLLGADPSLEKASVHRLLPAASLANGDRELLGRYARVTVHGFWRGDDMKNDPVSAGLAIHYPVGGSTAPMLAWSYARPRRTETSASRSSLVVPVADGLTLDFDVRKPLPVAQSEVVRRAGQLLGHARAASADPLLAPSAAEERCNLTIGSGSSPKLRRGTYVVAFRGPADSRTPDWSSLRLNVPAGGARLDHPLHQSSILGHGPATFDYLVLSIDPA